MSRSLSKSRNTFEPEEHSKIACMWQEKFGIPLQAFANFCFYRRAQKVWAFSDAALPKLSYESVGLRMMNLKEDPWKPTSCALQVFGRHATKNLVHLTSEQARILFVGRSQVLKANVEAGYIVVFHNGVVLGCGLYSHGKLFSQLPMECRVNNDAEIDI